jgi:hypothetical protein
VWRTVLSVTTSGSTNCRSSRRRLPWSQCPRGEHLRDRVAAAGEEPAGEREGQGVDAVAGLGDGRDALHGQQRAEDLLAQDRGRSRIHEAARSRIIERSRAGRRPRAGF